MRCPFCLHPSFRTVINVSTKFFHRNSMCTSCPGVRTANAFKVHHLSNFLQV